jgi:TonB-dependent starch-binding outer membrane protein SusC
MKKISKGILFSLLLLLSAISWAQNKTITGKVVDENGGVSGASVTVKNSTVGTTTNQDGEFTLSIPTSATTLVISFVGYTSREVIISGSTVSVTLAKSVGSSLDEVVVVGYGTQRKVNVTGAISTIKAKDLENIPNGRIEQALQGRVAGVTIMQNSGQPGSASTIRVRGVTTFGGGNNPLWVIDGVVVDAGGIGYLNQSDIESIEVLKDAASAAIYGTRAASGVILVTTKKGRAGKMTVNYNGFYGSSAPAKVLKLLNATQYATLMNERAVAGGGNVMFPDVASLGVGTDWQKAIFNNSAGRYLHEVSLSGGNEKSNFYVSAGIQDIDGIVATEISNYNKKNIRLNSTHKISKVFTFGQTLGYTHQESTGISTNSEFGGPLSSAINLDPITKLVITDPLVANGAPYNSNPVIRDADGNPYGISSIVGQEMTNPLAFIQTKLGGKNWSDDFIGNAYLEAAVIPGLKVRTTVGVKKAFWGNIGFTPVFYLNATNTTSQNNYNKGENRSFNWNVENTITYTKSIRDHNFIVLLGQAAYSENNGGFTGITLFNLPITSYKDASFSFDIPQTNRTSGASDFTEHNLSSLFARANYSYQDKYLFTGIVRRDGSTRFGPDKKFGIFPSFSAGWNVNKESFWKPSRVINYLKIRGGYGKVGSDNISNFGYVSTINGGNNYAIGTTGAVTTGYTPFTLDNPNLHWEETTSTNIGFETQLFSNINLTVDVYKKKSSGILRSVVIPGYVGVVGLPADNVADMQNTGVEVELGYRKRFGDLNLSVNGNVTYVKNEVLYVAADTNFVGGEASFQSMGAVTRIQVGQSYNAFWGYNRLGVFQNEAEIANNKTSNGTIIQPNARPGDFRWADTNGDGQITQLDKVFLGSNLPKFTFGFTINMDYKGFDMLAFAQGAAGNKIFQGLRRLDVGNANFPTKALGRWTGEGTSNDYPRLVSNDPNGNFTNMSDFYLEDGDYLRLKVLQFGYTLPNKWFGKTGISRLRVYVTGENLVTLTNYTGYDPEVGGGVFGIDKGQYPQARTFFGGIQLTF